MAPGSRSSDMRLIMANAEQGHYSVTGESWRLGPPNRMTVEHNDLTIEKSTNLLSSSWATHVNFVPPKLAQPSLVDNSEDWCSGNLAPGSVPALFQSKLRLSSPGPLSANVGFENTEDKGQQFDLLSELEWRTIGNLLPDDEELFSSFINDIDASGNVVGVNEELELFSSGGGLELENDAQDLVGSGNDSLRLLEAMPGGSTVQNGSTNAAGEHPFGEHPSRTLFVRNINSSVEDTELRALFEQYGDIRTLYTACKHRGFVMISYYDIRAARSAMRALQNKSLRRRKLDIHFSIPKDNPSDKDVNQGTLVVFNLDASVSNDDLRQIFGIYGEVKEIRETPHKRHHKFIEFYDVRSAEAALRALNRSDIAGKRIKLEPSRPGGARRSLMQQLTHDLEQEESSPLHEQVSSLLPNSAPVSLGIMGSHIAHSGPSEPLGMSLGMHQSPNTGSNILQEAPNHGMEPLQYSQASTVLSALKAQMIAEHHQRMDSVQSNNPSLFELSGGSQAALPPFMHPTGSLPPIHGLLCNSLNSVYEKPQRMLPVSQVISSHGSNGHAEHPSYVDSRTTAHLLAGAVCNQQSHIGSAPVTSLPLLNRYHGYLKESLDTSSMLMRNASLGTLGLGINGTQTHLFGSHSYTSHSFTGPVDLMGNGCIDHGAYANFLLMSRSRGSLSTGAGHDVLPSPAFQWSGDRSRNRKSENPVSQNDKKHYELDIDRIMRGDDMRTTLMIKNIPNKYTSKMLLAAIDEFHKGTYDFIYLPIDFKNKCNVGYAFINMTEPSRIVPFYQAFNGKRWEKFNSEKVASLAYARIQGKPALIAHFQNSSLMNEDKRCRPILFHSGGPNVGDQEPFPVGSNARTRSKSRGSNGVSQGSPISIINTRD